MKIILCQFVFLLILITPSYCNQFEIRENRSSHPRNNYKDVMKTLKALKLDSDIVIDSDENIDAILTLMKSLFQNKEIIEMRLSVIFEVNRQYIIKPSSSGRGKIIFEKGWDYYTCICLLLGANGDWVWYYDPERNGLVFIRYMLAISNEQDGLYKNKAKPMLQPSDTLQTEPDANGQPATQQPILDNGVKKEPNPEKTQK